MLLTWVFRSAQSSLQLISERDGPRMLAVIIEASEAKVREPNQRHRRV
jgi:hypothetical protein